MAIVDDELAAREWPGQSALGKKLNISDSPKGFYEFERDWVVVVGVVRHVQYHSLTTSVRPQIYVPFQLAPRPVSFVVRATAGTPPATLRAAIRAKLDEVDKSAPLARVVTLGELADQARAQNRFVAYLAAALAGIALLLACVGIAGVTSYSVAQRTNEIGLRMALGATSNNVLKMIVERNLVPVAVGLAVRNCFFAGAGAAAGIIALRRTAAGSAYACGGVRYGRGDWGRRVFFAGVARYAGGSTGRAAPRLKTLLGGSRLKLLLVRLGGGLRA